MFMLTKILAPCLYPLPLGLGILLAGLVLLWFSRRQRAGKVLVTLGTGLLVFLSSAFGANLLLEPLEGRYPPWSGPPAGEPVPWIVVLGGGLKDDPRLPALGKLSQESLHRIMEGVRIQRQMPGSKLLLSGGSVFGGPAETAVLAEAAVGLGAAPKDLLQESGSRNTEEQARLIQEIVGRDRFILVTSALHLPRAMMLFRSRGLRPIPAPAGSQIAEFVGAPRLWFPWPVNLQKSEDAVHEYLGLAWAWLRGPR
jgi:uncharacterized SAM-binding protein YcdF (DUF218 family)